MNNVEVITYPEAVSVWSGAMTAEEIREVDRQFALESKRIIGEVMDAFYRRMLTRDELREMRANAKIK